MTAARIVEFLVAGVQKGGTSALFEYLRGVPGLQLPDVKEAHFFDDEDGIDWSAPDYTSYHQLFVDDGRRWGEATPIYIYWPNALERIAAYNPAMKLILLLRDPIERAWSHWKMEYAKRKELQPFAWCIREGRRRVEAGDPAAPGHHRVYSYVERGFYGRQVEHLFRLFPPSQCLLLRSEDLRDDPAATLATVCEFLGTAVPTNGILPRTVHPARAMNYPSTLTSEDRHWLSRQYSEEMIQFEQISGLSTEPWIKYWPV